MSKIGRVAPRLDHVIVLTSNIDSGIDELTALTGVRAERGGRHPDHQTVNALASMASSYLELIAKEKGPASTDGLCVIDFAMGVDRIDLAAEQAARAGFSVNFIDGQRRAPDGTTLQWRAFELVDHDYGGTLPFFIDWGTTANPSLTAPAGLQSPRLAVSHPDAFALADLYRQLDINLSVREGLPGLRLDIKTPSGPVTLSGDARGWRAGLL